MNERDVFFRALEIEDPAARQGYIESVCGDDAELLARVVSLFASHDARSQFLNTPAVAQLVDDQVTLAEDKRQEGAETPLDFLQPSTGEGSLGRLSHYDVHEVLGQGAFGIVLKAFDEKLQRVVAIKVLSPDLAVTSPARKRFLREARAAAAIRHEHIVGIYAVEDEPLPYLVMEYVPGQTLQQRLDENGPLDLLQVLRIGKQIADGLAAAHSQGLIHRDVKPSNILLDTSVHDRVKITDFGLARTANDASMTQSSVIAGTPMYMAPEQALGQPLDQRADLFSLGSVLYQMLSGRPPFRAPTTLAVLKRVTEDTPRPIREIIPEVPEWMCTIVGLLHEKNPDDRFSSASEVSELLGKCLDDVLEGRKPNIELLRGEVNDGTLSIASPTRDLDARRSSRKRMLVAAVTLMVLLCGLGFTEATGVTSLTPTVIRLATGSGTHVIETDDPDLKIAAADARINAGLAAGVTHPVLASDQSSLPIKRQFASNAWIDVIPMIDPQLDKWDLQSTGANRWRIENSELIVGDADTKPSKLLLPLDVVSSSFECELEFTRRTGSSGFNLNIPTRESDCPFAFDPPGPGGLAVGTRGSAVVLADGAVLETGKRMKVRIQVRSEGDGDRVEVWSDGVSIATWKGNRDQLSGHGNEGYQANRRLSLWIHGGGNEFVFHRIRVRMLDGGRAEAVRPVPDSDSSAWPDDAPPQAVAPFSVEQARTHQEAWAEYLGVPIEYTNDLGMTFRLIPPGEFWMGKAAEEVDDLTRDLQQSGAGEFDVFVARTSGPRHRVRISQPFYLGKHEVTVGQYRRFIEATSYVPTVEQLDATGLKWQESSREPDADNHAVVGVSWDDANAFCNWLSREQGASLGLPTEAQWEYACRAGSTTIWFFGDDPAKLGDYAITDADANWPSTVVGSRQPNPFGLFDVLGNAEEWCQDWHIRDFYARSPINDPVCLENPTDKNSGRVVRGGGLHRAAWKLRSATRSWDFPAAPSNPKGFRVVLDVPPFVFDAD